MGKGGELGMRGLRSVPVVLFCACWGGPHRRPLCVGPVGRAPSIERPLPLREPVGLNTVFPFAFFLTSVTAMRVVTPKVGIQVGLGTWFLGYVCACMHVCSDTDNIKLTILTIFKCAAQ